MSRTKTRQALSILAGLAAVVLIALLATPAAWTLIPLLIVVLAVVLASPVDDQADIPNSASPCRSGSATDEFPAPRQGGAEGGPGIAA
jgi:hypothetical protein